MNSDLEKASTLTLPENLALWMHSGRVTRNGWVAAYVTATSQSQSQSQNHQTLVWDPNGNPVGPVGGELPYLFTDIAEIQESHVALAYRHLDDGVVYLLDANEGFFRTSKSLAGNRIRCFAGNGTAITADHQIWLNGELVPIADLCPAYQEMLDEGWSLHPFHANKHGTFLIGAERNGETAVLKLVPAAIVPDWNRDGKIDVDDYGRVTADNPWRFWINDDNDSGDTGGNDIPQGQDAPNTNSKNNKVDGIRDLVDFFPLFLDIRTLLEVMPPARFRYRLTHPHQVSDPALRVVLAPGLKPEDAGDYLRNLTTAKRYQAEFTFPIHSAGPRLVTGLGLPDMLDTLAEGKGLLLIEGVKHTTDPIILKIERKSDGKVVSEIPFHIRIEGVESMFRWKYVPPNSDPLEESDMPNDPPNWPDADRNDKHFLFVHGYNVNSDQSRGWAAETFKRMFWSGSNARFSAFAWRGHQNQIPHPLNPLTQKLTPNYHVNLINAFDTSKSFREFYDHLVDEEETVATIAAHSMGNIVVGSAMHDHGLRPANYIMLNTAAAKECYDASEVKTGNQPMDEQEQKMVHQAWHGYPPELRASEWHNWPAWPESDHRRTLTWRDRLRKVIDNEDETQVFNFYSSGEEVLNNPEQGDHYFNPFNPFSSTLPGWPRSNKVWAMSEKKKGYGLTGYILTSNYGGWAANKNWFISDIHTSVIIDDAPYFRMKSPNELPDPLTPQWLFARVQEPMSPFFNRSNHTDLYHWQIGADTPGSNYARDNRDLLISEMVPCTTFSAGRNPLGALPPSQNIDMDSDMKTDDDKWPLSNENQNDADPHEPESRPWLHSDIREKAFTHNWNAFTKFVEIGDLNDQ